MSFLSRLNFTSFTSPNKQNLIGDYRKGQDKRICQIQYEFYQLVQTETCSGTETFWQNKATHFSTAITLEQSFWGLVRSVEQSLQERLKQGFPRKNSIILAQI